MLPAAKFADGTMVSAIMATTQSQRHVSYERTRAENETAFYFSHRSQNGVAVSAIANETKQA